MQGSSGNHHPERERQSPMERQILRTADHEIHITQDGVDDWSVWLNPHDDPSGHTGVCLSSGKTRDQAAENAVQVLMATVAELRVHFKPVVHRQHGGPT